MPQVATTDSGAKTPAKRAVRDSSATARFGLSSSAEVKGRLVLGCFAAELDAVRIVCAECRGLFPRSKVRRGLLKGKPVLRVREYVVGALVTGRAV